MSALEKAKGLLANYIGKKSERQPLTETTYKDYYEQHDSFTDLLPWIDYDDEHGVFEFRDGSSCGIMFECDSVDVEGRPDKILKSLEQQIVRALDAIPQIYGNPFIVQMYLQDEPIQSLMQTIKDYATPEAKETEHHKIWMAELERHVTQISRPEGLFYDTGSNTQWRGTIRKIRCTIYRTTKRSDWLKKGDKPAKGVGSPADEVNHAYTALSSSLEQAGVAVKRGKREDLITWMLPWLSPNLEGYKDAYEYLDSMPIHNSEPDEYGAGYDLASQVTVKKPRSTVDGIWYFCGSAQRFISLQAIDSAPTVGILTAEQKNAGNVSTAMWEQMPQGSIFAMTIAIDSQDSIKEHCNQIIHSAGNANAEAIAAKEQAEGALANMSKRRRLYKMFSGVYLRAKSRQQLEKITVDALTTLRSAGFNPVEPKYDPTAQNSFIRSLPMAYSYAHDLSRAKRSRLTYAHHIVRIMPLYGRGKGTGNPGQIFFNRIGEPFTFDPSNKKDRKKTAHGLLFGPTGAGKSATINLMVLHQMAMKLPRIFIVEAGNSFGLLGDYFKEKGFSVNHVRFTPKTNISLPPYAYAFEALSQIESDKDVLNHTTDDDDIDEILENITADKSSNDADEAEEVRDYLGEMELSTILMITGAEAKEEARMTRADRLIVRRSIINAAQAAKDAGRDFVLPEHVVSEIVILSEEEGIGDNRRDRIREMSQALDLWTQGIHGKFFNRPGEAWPEADVTIVDMGILTSESNKDMLAVALISLLNTISGIGEKYQYQDRETFVYTDEGHVITTNPTLIKPVVYGVKTWRKLGIWLWQATQNLADYPDEAKKMLNLAEWWLCLTMPAAEVEDIARFKPLNEEQRLLLTQARKEPGKYTEGVVLSDTMTSLFRVVTPPMPLALAMTDKDEKAERNSIARENKCSDVDAALLMGERIYEAREKAGT